MWLINDSWLFNLNSHRLFRRWWKVLTGTRRSAFCFTATAFTFQSRNSFFLEKFLDLSMLGANMSNKSELGLALEIALRTFERRCGREAFC